MGFLSRKPGQDVARAPESKHATQRLSSGSGEIKIQYPATVMRKTDDVERDAELDQERVVDDATLEVNRKIFRAEDDESAVAGGLIQIFNSKRDAPTWPTSFRSKTPPSVVRNSVNNAPLLPKLREKERGDWKKIYEDVRRAG